ncbi:Putative integral membrane protein (DUF2391) [Halovivax ruber XH-70]|uniref:Putative integral membrane protein (DUF2391) n=1 Tax=Halovivax ruber (strain DSM 18193 / JCM 13892 / XH-70) TaxID=797302 RepID=L0IDB6_HALRX|nr:DUF2391 family protein [Halovivax ruber]AGB16798.1 Putative integral membrane protein (DUF2391) [Halovivax ruber XH-70]
MNASRFRRPPEFKLTDVAQQLVGGFLLAGPFVVTEEVWDLAASMNAIQALLTVTVVFAIGYASLYKANDDRDVDAEQEVAGVPLRFISLMLVSFGSVTILALLFDAPDVFVGGSLLTASTFETTITAISVGSIFSVVGASTADTLF